MPYPKYNNSGSSTRSDFQPSPWQSNNGTTGSQGLLPTPVVPNADASLGLLGSLLGNSGALASLAGQVAIAQALNKNLPQMGGLGGNQIVSNQAFNQTPNVFSPMRSGTGNEAFGTSGRNDDNRRSRRDKRDDRCSFGKHRSSERIERRDRSPIRRDRRSPSNRSNRNKSSYSSANDSSKGEKRSDYEIYVGNYPLKFNENDIRSLFEKYDLPVQTIRLKYEGQKAFAFVDVGCEENMNKSIKVMDSLEVKGRRLRVRLSKKSGRNLQSDESSPNSQRKISSSSGAVDGGHVSRKRATSSPTSSPASTSSNPRDVPDLKVGDVVPYLIYSFNSFIRFHAKEQLDKLSLLEEREKEKKGRSEKAALKLHAAKLSEESSKDGDDSITDVKKECDNQNTTKEDTVTDDHAENGEKKQDLRHKLNSLSSNVENQGMSDSSPKKEHESTSTRGDGSTTSCKFSDKTSSPKITSENATADLILSEKELINMEKVAEERRCGVEKKVQQMNKVVELLVNVFNVPDTENDPKLSTRRKLDLSFWINYRRDIEKQLRDLARKEALEVARSKRMKKEEYEEEKKIHDESPSKKINNENEPKDSEVNELEYEDYSVGILDGVYEDMEEVDHVDEGDDDEDTNVQTEQTSSQQNEGNGHDDSKKAEESKMSFEDTQRSLSNENSSETTNDIEDGSNEDQNIVQDREQSLKEASELKEEEEEEEEYIDGSELLDDDDYGGGDESNTDSNTQVSDNLTKPNESVDTFVIVSNTTDEVEKITPSETTSTTDGFDEPSPAKQARGRSSPARGGRGGRSNRRGVRKRGIM